MKKLNCLQFGLKLKTSLTSFREKIKRLEQQLKLEHNDGIRMIPSQSQTQVQGWEYINQVR